jgi:hypothetical protein
MVVTIMASTPSLLDNLHRDFPDIRFTPGDSFRWSPEEHAVYYADTDDTASLIHEVAHATLKHAAYTRDIDLIKMERDAWEYAVTTLSVRYGLEITDDTVQDALDTYRGWLHSRSTCPKCQATGVQTGARTYTCLACKAAWRVNEARSCMLRRYTLS